MALWALRRALHGVRRCGGEWGGGEWGSEVGAAMASLRRACGEARSRGGRGLSLALPGSLAPATCDECLLLRATAAAQAADSARMEDFLSGLVPGGGRALAHAVVAFGAALAVTGYWLPEPPPRRVLAASALTVACLRGTALADVEVAWPPV